MNALATVLEFCWQVHTCSSCSNVLVLGQLTCCHFCAIMTLKISSLNSTNGRPSLKKNMFRDFHVGLWTHGYGTPSFYSSGFHSVHCSTKGCHGELMGHNGMPLVASSSCFSQAPPFGWHFAQSKMVVSFFPTFLSAAILNCACTHGVLKRTTLFSIFFVFVVFCHCMLSLAGVTGCLSIGVTCVMESYAFLQKPYWLQ